MAFSVLVCTEGGGKVDARMPLAGALLSLVLAGCGSPIERGVVVREGTTKNFVNVTSAVGIATRNARGAGWADYDNDGCVDLLVSQAKGLRLFHNTCAGAFTNVTREAGLGRAAGGVGVAWADYDGDGFLDLYIASTSGPNMLFQNRGDGTFIDVTRTAGVGDPRSSTGAAWGDYDHDGDLDLFVANRFYPKPTSDITDSLYRNNGDGSFTEVGRELGVTVADRKTYMGVWFDYDHNGTLDLYLTVDFADDILFSNDGQGRFTDVSRQAGITGPAHSMGLAVGDINGDGCHDLVATNNTRGKPEDLEHGPTILYVNNCRGGFVDATERWGMGDRGTVDWGVNFVDWDNDGDQDLAIVAGGMLEGGEYETNLLYENNGVRLIDVTRRSGATVTGAAYGSAWADFDNDGDLDWFIANSRKPSVLLENRAAQGGYLSVRLRGAAKNRDAVGARVEVTVGGRLQVRTIQAGMGYASSEPLEAHFGLGDAKRIDTLRIDWPGGGETTLEGIVANQRVIITQTLD